MNSAPTFSTPFLILDSRAIQGLNAGVLPGVVGPASRQPRHRLEDGRFVTGQGRFTADFAPDGVAHAVVVRSQVAHGRIVNIDADTARASEGVLDVITGEDVRREGLGGIPWEVCPPGMEGRAKFRGDPDISEPQPLLALDRVKYVGEPIAFVVAETLADALAAAESIVVDIEGEEAIAEASIAASRGEPLFRYRMGDAAAVAAILKTAPVVVEITTHIARLVAAPIETRGYLATFDRTAGGWTVIASAGKPHPVRDTIARHVFHVEPEAIRVIAPDIGGGFGAKNVAHAEMALALWAAQRTGRPVRWVSTRNEAFLSDMQGRDHAIRAKLAVDAHGRMLAIEYFSNVNLGAYLAPRGVIPCISGLKVLTGPYRIGQVCADVAAFRTNTVPTCPYRGAGAPETAFALERLVDMAARRLNLDPSEFRRRNLIAPSDLPWTSPTGAELHSVNFPAVLEEAIARADWPNLASSPTGATKRRGRGMAFTIEGYGTSFDEEAEVVIDGEGRIEVRIGTKSGGQSHETTYAQIVADVFDVDLHEIAVIQHDTDLIRRGNGTGASRSLTTGGSALQKAARLCLEEARSIAAKLLQCTAEETSYAAAKFFTEGGSEIELREVVRSLPAGLLRVTDSFRPDMFSFPGGCHLAEVEVDTETGDVEVLRYIAVHDAGVAVNTSVVEGQLHGAIAQGLGAALMESMEYDPETAQALSATFVDYAIPRAGDIPDLRIGLLGTPCDSNPLGAKAVGEAGTVGAPPAIINAIVDALAGFGVEHIDMPATPSRVWRAIGQAREATIPSLHSFSPDLSERPH